MEHLGDYSPEQQAFIKNRELFPIIPSDHLKDELRLWGEEAPDPRLDLDAANARYNGMYLLLRLRSSTRFILDDFPLLLVRSAGAIQ